VAHRQAASPELVDASVASLPVSPPCAGARTACAPRSLPTSSTLPTSPRAATALLGEVVWGRRRVIGGEHRFHAGGGQFTGVRSWGRTRSTWAPGWRTPATSRSGAIDEYSLGGFQHLSGYRVGQVAGNYLVFGRLTYYRRLPWNVGVARALFAGGSLEAGNAWATAATSLATCGAGSSLFVGADTGVGRCT
jgi:NTE family protein